MQRRAFELGFQMPELQEVQVLPSQETLGHIHFETLAGSGERRHFVCRRSRPVTITCVNRLAAGPPSTSLSGETFEVIKTGISAS